MSNLKTPFRYDYVGSFLRPAKLKKARADYEAGTISAEQLKSVEDECIIQLVNKIKELGSVSYTHLTLPTNSLV